ncbi:MAG: family 16 glycoside hydrolase, partial [Bacteroidota bacterium]
TQLQSANFKASEAWHTIRVTMTADRIECYFDGKKYLDVKDSTFREAGKIGLWTKSDAQTHFDDLIAMEKEK